MAFIPLLLFASKFSYILLRFEVHYRWTFNTIKQTFFSNARRHMKFKKMNVECLYLIASVKENCISPPICPDPSALLCRFRGHLHDCFEKQWNFLKMWRKCFSVLVHFCHVNVPLETASEYYNPWCLCACVLMETGSSCIMAADYLRKLLWACLSKVMTIKPEIRENVLMLNCMQQTHLQVSMSMWI